MKLHESGENYLETILLIQKRESSVRAIDIANELNFSRASVSRAMSSLKASQHIEIIDNKITLTELGLKVANAIYEKHCVFKEFLIHIGVEEKTASEEACKMEHVVSDETFRCLKEFVNGLNL